MRLELLYDGEVVHVCEVGAGPLHLGRAPVNHVVLREPDVSGHHAVVWVDGDGLLFEDLGSTNGSWLGDERVVGRRRLAVGDVVRLGHSARVRVSPSHAGPREPLVLEAVDGRLSWGVTGPHAGGGRVALPVEGDAALLLDDDGPWLLLAGARTRIVLDVPFEACGETFVLRPARGPLSDTVRGEDAEPDCAVRVWLADARAIVTAPSGATCEVRTEPRVALLYALGRRWRDDTPGPGRGWLDDVDVATAVWGRARADRANALNVLVHRLREALDRAGLDRRIIEKRVGSTRLRARVVELE